MGTFSRRLLAAGCTVLAVLTAPAHAASFTIPWGTSDTQLGIINEPEQERTGPRTFTISPAGNWVVADTVNGAVKEFTPDGALARVLARGVRPSSMAFDGDGNLLVLDGLRITVLSPAGEKVRAIELPADLPLIEGYGQEVFAEGAMVAVNDPDENTYLFKPDDAKPQAPTAVRVGRAAGAGIRAYTTQRGGTLCMAVAPEGAGRDSEAESITPVAKTEAGAERLGAVLYRGRDGRNLVWEVEEIAPSAVHLFVRRGSSGAAKTEIPNSYFTTIYKKFEVRDGVIHQMLTSPAGVEFTSRRLAQ